MGADWGWQLLFFAFSNDNLDCEVLFFIKLKPYMQGCLSNCK